VAFSAEDVGDAVAVAFKLVLSGVSEGLVVGSVGRSGLLIVPEASVCCDPSNEIVVASVEAEAVANQVFCQRNAFNGQKSTSRNILPCRSRKRLPSATLASNTKCIA